MYIPSSNATFSRSESSDIFSGSDSGEFILLFSGIGLLFFSVLFRCYCIYYNNDKHAVDTAEGLLPTYEQSEEYILYTGQQPPPYET